MTRFTHQLIPANSRTGEIIDVEMSRDEVRDSEMAKRMIERSMKSKNVSRVMGDGAYDSMNLYRYLEGKHIEPVINKA